MIKKIALILLLGCSLSNPIDAQLYGNEWIDYSQTYYKFGIHRDDIYRISISSLAGLGLPSAVNGADFQLFRDGAEVPIYVSSAGSLTSTDYIEFFGEKANGAVDAPLYKNPASQLNPNQNLLSDTAYYFLTFNNSPNHKRFNPRSNNVVSPPVKESYFWDKTKINYKGSFAAGPSYYYPTTPIIYLNSSQYEDGEGYSKTHSYQKDSITYTCLFPYKISGGPNAYFKTTVVGYSYLNQHRIQLFANNTLMADSNFSSFGYKRFNAAVPMSLLPATNKLVMKYVPMNNDIPNNLYDRYGIAYSELRYPREFNFNNVDSFYFELDPKLTDYYLEISNFNHGGAAPRLYDLSANEYLTGDMSISGIVRYRVPASNQIKRLMIQSQAGSSSLGSVTGLQKVSFKNYTQSAQQGDYIILTHKALFNDGTGANYIEEYKNYRASIAGGSYSPVVVDVNDIYNEFGYGYVYHPQSVKNFLHFAHNNVAWSNKPKFVFIIGKGINYNDYLQYSAGIGTTFLYNAIPSFGEPCSDVLLTDFDFSSKPQIPIGRLPAWNGSDVNIYLQKIKEHEISVLDISHQNTDSSAWKKNVLHIAGAKKATEQAPILSALTMQENVIKNQYYGANVTTIKKSTTSSVETANSALIDKLFKGGLNLVQFFGHASSSSLDYNLDNPELMTNKGRYPVFLANGCGVGNVFILVAQRTLGEKFVLSPNGGSIAFIASNNTGLSDKLSTYTDTLYRQIGVLSYGKTIGEQIKNNITSLKLNTDALLRQHAEQIILNGDPATSMHYFAKPDYAVEDKGLSFAQINLTTNLDSFDIKTILYNLGQYTKDSVSVLIKRTLPNGIENILLNKKYPGIAFSDTISLRIPIEGSLALGDNSLDIIIDQEGFIDETSESNNSIRRIFTIYNDDLVPVYPYEYGIVGIQGVTLKGSTLNPFADLRKYLIQIDTTENFNSPSLVSTSISDKGGVIKWQPPITLRDSTVYYWRTAMDTLYGNKKHKWSTSSFIYLDGSLPGWNQSHYFQFQKDRYSDIYLDSASRDFKFVGVIKKLQVQNVCLYSPAPYYHSWADYRVKMNGSTLFTDGCDPYPGYSSLQFMVIDTLNGQPWINEVVGSGGRFGSFKPCRVGTSPNFIDPFFEFSFLTPASRKNMSNFIDSIPQGYYVLIQPRLCTGTTCGSLNKTFIKDWKSDTTIYGSNNSLYHKINNLGFTAIDSFYKNRPMAFFGKKNIPSSIQQVIEQDSTKVLNAEFTINSTLYEGNIASDRIGPAKLWDKLIKRGLSKDVGIGDSTLIDIYGITPTFQETLIASVRNDTSLSFIDAKTYPMLRLVLHNEDNVFNTPEQLKHWRILYQLVPEAALSPNRHFVYKDSVQQGELSSMSIAIENLTELPLDSMLVKFDIIDKNKNRRTVATKRYSPIPIYDTIHANIELNSSQFDGQNIFVIEANPGNDQSEQFHPNNIGYLNYFVAPDKQNPLIDVTFDGVHILDKDIVSSKPFIQILLKDENKYLALDDTSLVGVYMRFQNDNPLLETYIPFDGTTLKFIPADLTDGKSKNLARIEYRPEFTVDGKNYMLIVRAKDKSGNQSGKDAYRVGFEIVNKPSISSVVNYPNPFTTSTQFVFTITGSQIPSNIKIQVLSPTGKIVKEILKSDLGPLHIGTNITEYKWKGDDQYGQPLGNGVYLYRVVSNLNGNKMEHRETGADTWIEKGFGKLYIMR